MTRIAIDAATAIRIVHEGVTISDEHSLVAPKVLHSHALASVYRSVHDGEMTEPEGRAILVGITTMSIRLLGDRVSRATAWRIADQLGWTEIGNAEYLAVAQLQADVFVTLDESLAHAADGLVVLAPFEDLSR